jgi:hypothetical protein
MNNLELQHRLTEKIGSCRGRYSTRLFVFNCQVDQALYLAKDQGRDRVGIN